MNFLFFALTAAMSALNFYLFVINKDSPPFVRGMSLFAGVFCGAIALGFLLNV